MSKNSLSDNSGNAESIKKLLQHFESLTNVPIVGEDLLTAFRRLFYLQLCDSNNHNYDS